MSTPRRVLLAGLFHETHTFIEGRTTLEECAVRRGDELLAARGDASPIGAIVEVADELNWEIIPVVDVRAMPSATMVDAAVELWWNEVEKALRAALPDGLDGVYLVLHGAMVSESWRDVEGELLRRVRAVVGESTPIAGVTDLHANFTRAMSDNSSVIVAYRENPHIDSREASLRAAALLDRLMRSGERAVTVWEHPPVVWPPTGTGTADEPMRSLEALAREIEAKDAEILVANVHAGYSFADTPDTGVSFSIVTVGDPETARGYLRQLCELAVENRAAGNPTNPSLESVMPRVREAAAASPNGPLILVEPSDNIGGGAPGDDTAILRALLENEIQNAAVIINDPAAVQAVSQLQPGESTRVSIGGKGSRLGSGPIELEVELLSTSDGRFELEDKQSHLSSMVGDFAEMGPSATVRCQGVTILLSTHKTAPFDLNQLRSQGIVPEKMSVIGVKAAVAHRRAYDPIMSESITVSTPGPCASDLTTLPFQHIERPIYPLDEIENS